jgi:glycosyltransferase involved in cell wall biosynthesis
MTRGLTIVVPALNEEEAIAAIIERCLDARAPIAAEAGLSHVDIVVVSDGSTDRTVTIASQYKEVELIVFPTNQGYGAAIQTGWSARPNELLAFIDADGTCEPLFFGEMCRRLLDDGAAICLGSRMGPDSQMPRIRRLGNRCYAWLLRLLSGRQVQDSASGMRVIRRDALPRLMPLPTGLHFTPAMSARALMDEIPILEIPMTYRERVGRSKLSVIKDGVRFLRVILATALYVRPARVLLPIALLLLLMAGSLLTYPIFEYVRFRHVDDWMIYRFLFASLCVQVAMLIGSTAYIVSQVVAVARAEHQLRLQSRDRWWSRVDERWLAWGGTAIAVVGLALAWPGLVSYFETGHLSTHWSRIVTAMNAELLAAQCFTTILVGSIVRGVVLQQAAWRSQKGERVEQRLLASFGRVDDPRPCAPSANEKKCPK